MWLIQLPERFWRKQGTKVTKELATDIQNAGVPFVWIQGEKRNHKVLSNMMVDLAAYVNFDPEEVGVTELVFYPVLQGILEENAGASDEELKEIIRRDIHDLIPKHITKEDIIASINYNMHLEVRYRQSQMISTIWATVVSVRSASCFRTSTVSVCPVWSVWYVSV